MTERKHRAYLKRMGQTIVGEFRNEFGELFILSKSKWLPTVWFAGDETDWEEMVLDTKKMVGVEIFTFEKEEIKQIKSLLKIK